MRLLLTRSAADAARTREKLEALGHRVIISPVTDTIGTGAVWPAGVVDAVLASSAHAFLVPNDGPSSEARRLMPLLIVGNRTLEAARAVGFLGASRVAPTAASLADVIGKLVWRPRRMVYLAGRARKPDLETALAGMDQAFRLVEVYDARAIDAFEPDIVIAFRQNAVDGALHFSRRSADIFAALGQEAGVDFRRPAHFCLSEDVARPLREAGCSSVLVAPAPNEAELLALVDAFAKA